ncbi:hypothetical protein H9Q69_008334 [Fusarium xylarioides]|uniref:Uncharacterized protein n=1 Tax=Fusarium xylarioides TaxID=221167 RepID=A0A9P7L484_9HYPO|nr:hypothetical protein H9Q70_012298 [Fusarium xylarioides]KAG5760505.1 hypothetical protein H9Q72_011376 [Fusarium xylarioides]KAG5773574.1 hypothetical protein H9Q73_012047 [Fusarium xylarioides]KAG5792628.1 hypothetical protein H9Q69_008334 [Fusarium xylarioides]KAG5807743.1 hypothetical protein H9Q71_007693 [Fusarium xylarioides]
MKEAPQRPRLKLLGIGSRACIHPDLLGYWKQLLDRRLAWIRHHRENPHINPNVDTNKLISDIDGLPTCEHLPLEPDGFEPLPYCDKDSNTVEMKLLFAPANRAWAREHVAQTHMIERVTHILQERSAATHFAWGRVFDWLYGMHPNRVIKTLELMEQVAEARRLYARDFEQLKHFAENPHAITQQRDSLCIQTMCRIIGLDVDADDRFDWLYQEFHHMKLKCREEWIRNIILPAHEALAAAHHNKPDQRASIAVYVAERVRALLEADHNLRLYQLLDDELIGMMIEVRNAVPPL